LYSKIKKILCKIVAILEKYFSPLLLLAMRLWMANIFFKSGQTKFSNMETTKLLFEYEYALPIISPNIAAYLATFAELTLPILLVFGFASRFAAAKLIIMTLIIQFLVIQNQEHFYWLFLLSTILFYGAGPLSMDYFIKKKCVKKKYSFI
jgi:putative oxidoreductase